MFEDEERTAVMSHELTVSKSLESTEQSCEETMPILHPINTPSPGKDSNGLGSQTRQAPQPDLEMMIPVLHSTADHDTPAKSEELCHANVANTDQMAKEQKSGALFSNTMATQSTDYTRNGHENDLNNNNRPSLKRSAEIFIENLIRMEMSENCDEDNANGNHDEIADKIKDIYKLLVAGNRVKKARIDREGSSSQSISAPKLQASVQSGRPPIDMPDHSAKKGHSSVEKTNKPCVEKLIIKKQLSTYSVEKMHDNSVVNNTKKSEANINNACAPLDLVVKKVVKQKEELVSHDSPTNETDENGDSEEISTASLASRDLPDQLHAVSETSDVKYIKPDQKIASSPTNCQSPIPDQITASTTTASSPIHQVNDSKEKKINTTLQNETKSLKDEQAPVTFAEYILSEFGVADAKKNSKTVLDESRVNRKETIRKTEEKDDSIKREEAENEKQCVPETNDIQTQNGTVETKDVDDGDKQSSESSHKAIDNPKETPLKPTDKTTEQVVVKPTENDKTNDAVDLPKVLAEGITPQSQQLINEFYKLVEDAMVHHGHASGQWDETGSNSSGGSNNDNEADGKLMKDTSVTPDENGKMTYNCNRCKISFPHLTDLQMHTFTHYRRRHRCPACSKEFPNLSGVKRHMIIHTRLKPFICPKCNRAFNLSTNLRKHYQRMHDGTLPIFSHRKGNTSNISNENGEQQHQWQKKQEDDVKQVGLSSIHHRLSHITTHGGPLSPDACAPSTRMTSTSPKQQAAEGQTFPPDPIYNRTFPLSVADMQQQIDAETLLKLHLPYYLNPIQAQAIMDKTNLAHLGAGDTRAQKTELERRGFPPTSRYPNDNLPPWKSPGNLSAPSTGGGCRCLDCPHSIYNRRAFNGHIPQQPQQGASIPGGYPDFRYSPPPGLQYPFRQMPGMHPAASGPPIGWPLEGQLRGQVPINRQLHVSVAKEDTDNGIRGESRSPHQPQLRTPPGVPSVHFNASNLRHVMPPTSVTRLPIHRPTNRKGRSPPPPQNNGSLRESKLHSVIQHPRVQLFDPTKLNPQMREEMHKYFASLHRNQGKVSQKSSPTSTPTRYSPPPPRQKQSEHLLPPSQKPLRLDAKALSPQRHRNREPTNLELLQRMHAFQNFSEAPAATKVTSVAIKDSSRSLPLDLTRK